MNRKFVKEVRAKSFEEAVQKMKKAQSLGFMVDVNQEDVEPFVYSGWAPQGVYRITLYEPVKDGAE
ncbi:hypothetical protein [Bacillus subtilis]|uniref:hypothetical protein n=1 Tax=Bacillus subtilis TaxID=1423 RepID=UPI0031F59AA7